MGALTRKARKACGTQACPNLQTFYLHVQTKTQTDKVRYLTMPAEQTLCELSGQNLFLMDKQEAFSIG